MRSLSAASRGAALVCLAALAVPAGGDSVAELDTRVGEIAGHAVGAGSHLVGGGRAEAVADLDLCCGAVDELIERARNSRPELGASRAKFERLLLQLRKKFRSAWSRTNSATVQPWTAQHAIGSAHATTLAARVLLQRTDGLGLSLQEMNARSAGFHDPGRAVRFKVQAGRRADGGTCEEVPTVFVRDVSGGGSVVEGFLPVQGGPNTRTWTFDIAMGAAGGPGRVEVTACGVTRTWELLNYGPRNAYPVLPKPTVARFDGAYTGGCSGWIRVPGMEPVPYAEDVAFVVTGGRVQVDSPGSGTGVLASSGTARFAGGAGGHLGARYTFRGKFQVTVAEGATANGSWQATFDGGTGSGTWWATRP